MSEKDGRGRLPSSFVKPLYHSMKLRAEYTDQLIKQIGLQSSEVLSPNAMLDSGVDIKLCSPKEPEKPVICFVIRRETEFSDKRHKAGACIWIEITRAKLEEEAIGQFVAALEKSV